MSSMDLRVTEKMSAQEGLIDFAFQGEAEQDPGGGEYCHENSSEPNWDLFIAIDASAGSDEAYTTLRAGFADGGRTIDLIRTATRCAATACLAKARGRICGIRLRKQPEEIDGCHFRGIVEMTPLLPEVDFKRAFDGDWEGMIALAGSMALEEIVAPMLLDNALGEGPKLGSLASLSAIEPYLRRMTATERDLLGIPSPTAEEMENLGNCLWYEVPRLAEVIRVMEKTRELLHRDHWIIEAIVLWILRCYRHGSPLELDEEEISSALHWFTEVGDQKDFLSRFCGLFLKEWDPYDWSVPEDATANWTEEVDEPGGDKLAF